MSKTRAELQAVRHALLAAYRDAGLWGESQPEMALPDGVTRGSDTHLAFLTLTTAVSGGRDPAQLWTAARHTCAVDVELFRPDYLAYVQPRAIQERLQAHGLVRKRSNATVWQRIGQALVMRAGGSVSRLLADHDHDADRLLTMLADNKATFPVLSGPQTASRWLYILATAGAQPISGADRLPVPVSPAAARALQSLEVAADAVSAAVFAPLTALGTYGCAQRQADQPACPVATACPVAAFCQYGRSAT